MDEDNRQPAIQRPMPRSSDPVSVALGFIDLATIGAVEIASEYDAVDMYTQLIADCRDDNKDVSHRAMKMLMGFKLKAAEVSGMIGKREMESEHRDENGVLVKTKLSARTLMNRYLENPQHGRSNSELAAPVSPHRVINAHAETSSEGDLPIGKLGESSVAEQGGSGAPRLFDP